MPLDTARATRSFSVHGHAEAPSRGRLVEGSSFIDAALGFVEEFHPAPEVEDAVSLIVEDCATGERQCFRIDLATGEAAPCD
ncbi:MAG: hypothetical protein JWQ97_1307 [Phenylobacterium sp.]|nr:hypothetical protein [Phenylobacterium sp.]